VDQNLDHIKYYINGDHLHIHGSNDVFDWWRNILAIPVPFHGAWAHLGYVLVAKKIIKSLDLSGIRLITGFSFGGGVALVLGHYFRDIPVVSVASPKVGIGLKSNATNIIDKRDLIIKPWPWFSRPGEEFLIKGDQSGLLIHSPSNYQSHCSFNIFEV